MSSYLEDHFNPHNSHDTSIYCCYRTSDNVYVGSVADCRTEREAIREAYYQFNCECYVRVEE